MHLYQPVFCILFISAAAVFRQAESQTLEFPAFVQNNPVDSEDLWNFHTTLNGDNIEIYFHGDTFVAIYKGAGYHETNEQIRLNASIVKIDESAEDKIYFTQNNDASSEPIIPRLMCIIFHPRTDNVVQISTGKANETGTDSYVCVSPEMLEWPLVANKARKWYVNLCSLIGGFNVMEITSFEHPQEQETYCSNQPIRALMESECTNYEGLQFTFADKTCIPKYTGWALEQSLTCLDTWTDGNYSFTLLGDYNNDKYNPQYCMRSDVAPSTSHEVIIYQDMMCPTGEPVNFTSYITMNVQTKIGGLCEDDIACNKTLCSYPLYKASCRATCGYCDNLVEKVCVFDEEVITPGNWMMNMDIDLDTQLETRISFNDSYMHWAWSEADLSMSCSEKHDSPLHNSYVMNITTAQGCLPRYTCGKFSRTSPSVLQYKLSQFQKGFVTANDLCSEDNFKDDPLPLSSLIKSREYNIIVANDTSLLSKTVPCDFNGNHTLNITVHKTGYEQVCSGSMTDYDGCVQNNNITVAVTCNNQTSNNQPEEYITELDCLATLDFGSTSSKALVTRTTNLGLHQLLCWVMVPGTNPLEFYVMSSPQCDPYTLDDISTGDREPEVHVAAQRIEQCTGGVSTEGPEPTGTTKSPPSVETNPTGTAEPDTTSKSDGTAGTSESPSFTSDNPPFTTSNGTSTSVQPKSTEQVPEGSPGPSAGEVIGILIGVIAGAILIGAVGWFIYKQYLVRRQPYRVL